MEGSREHPWRTNVGAGFGMTSAESGPRMGARLRSNSTYYGKEENGERRGERIVCTRRPLPI